MLRYRIGKYFIVALAGLVVDYGTLITTKELLGFNLFLATCSGFILGISVNYILSNRYVFTSPKIKSNTFNFLFFVFIGLVGLGILNGLMAVLVLSAGINYVVAKTLATAIVFAWNYIARSFLYHKS